MAVIKLNEWPLGYDEGLTVNYAYLGGYAIPLPPRKMWYEAAEGTAVLFEQNGQKHFLVTLARANTGGVDTVVQWVERNGFGKVATAALKAFLTALMKSRMLGGIVGAVVGVIIPTNKPYYEWTSKTSIDGKDVPVMVLLLGF